MTFRDIEISTFNSQFSFLNTQYPIANSINTHNHMKKTLLLIAALATLASAMAKPVEPTTASRIASHWLQAVTGKTYDNLTDITAQTPFHEFYVFTLRAEGGFILIAADDCVLPVLGYSETSTFPVRDMPAHVKDWMDVYEEQIAFYRERYGELDHGGSSEVRKQWDNLENGVAPLPPMATAVSPLVTTQWNQSPYYNNLCPLASGGPDGHALTGCVATAMAQVMKYWNYPSYGVGSHSYNCNGQTLTADFAATNYDWENMAETYYTYYANPNDQYAVYAPNHTDTEITAVATLMYHCGVSVDMNYGGGGSGAFSNDVAPALRNYFNYSSTVEYKRKSYTNTSADPWVTTTYYSDSEWIAILKEGCDC